MQRNQASKANVPGGSWNDDSNHQGQGVQSRSSQGPNEAMVTALGLRLIEASKTLVDFENTKQPSPKHRLSREFENSMIDGRRKV